MSTADRPWWASDDDRLTPDVDPVEAHRRARRPAPSDDRPQPGSSDPPCASDAPDEADAAEATEHGIDACGVCPICVGLRALGDARPDLVVHLAEAARHLALAVRTVVDAATDGSNAAAEGGPARHQPRSEGLQRIDVDG